MNVRDAIEALSKMDPDLVLIVAVPSPGNNLAGLRHGLRIEERWVSSRQGRVKYASVEAGALFEETRL